MCRDPSQPTGNSVRCEARGCIQKQDNLAPLISRLLSVGLTCFLLLPVNAFAYTIVCLSLGSIIAVALKFVNPDSCGLTLGFVSGVLIVALISFDSRYVWGLHQEMPELICRKFLTFQILFAAFLSLHNVIFLAIKNNLTSRSCS